MTRPAPTDETARDWDAWYSARRDRMQRLLRGAITVEEYVASIKAEVAERLRAERQSKQPPRRSFLERYRIARMYFTRRYAVRHALRRDWCSIGIYQQSDRVDALAHREARDDGRPSVGAGT